MVQRLGSKFEHHTMGQDTFKKYKNNELINEILKIKEIDNHRLYHTIRENGGKQCVGIYVNGIVTYLMLEDDQVYLVPNKLVKDQIGYTKEQIEDLDSYKEKMKNIITEYDNYQEKNPMLEKVFQHHLIDNINDVKTLSDKYGKVTIIDEELFIFLTEYKARENDEGRVDLVGVSEKGKLLFIEVKIDGSVILGNNGINKHCYDINEYCKNAKYSKNDLNAWIDQLNELFGKKIPHITNDMPDFIILCGYNKEAKYDVIDQIAEIISEDMIKVIRNDSNIVQVVKGKPETVKALKEHFNDIKKNHPTLILAEVKDNRVVRDFLVNQTRINYTDKSWHTIRTSLIGLTK